MLLRRTAPLLHRATRGVTRPQRACASTGDTRPPARKASALLGQLQKEALAKVHRPWPDFKAGDAIEMEILVDVELGRRNRGADSSVQLFCRVLGTPMRRHVPLYSPLVKSITVLQKAWLTKGKKRVKRRNLDYLWKQGKTFRVP
jgi:ribosomal protein L19